MSTRHASRTASRTRTPWGPTLRLGLVLSPLAVLAAWLLDGVLGEQAIVLGTLAVGTVAAWVVDSLQPRALPARVRVGRPRG